MQNFLLSLSSVKFIIDFDDSISFHSVNFRYKRLYWVTIKYDGYCHQWLASTYMYFKIFMIQLSTHVTASER